MEAGSLNGTNQSRVASCDLVFTTGMDEKGLTYTRDAMLVADAGGKGPLFEGPVYTLWGYGTHTSPAPTAGTYFRQNAGNDTVDSSGYQPAVATQDITLPTTVGTDGIQTNSCVYYGPTRVVLNGDGTATVNSPDTTSPVSGADAGCYPTGLGATGMTNFTLNYATTGSGTIYVKNLSTPTGGVWPQSSLTSQSTPSAGNEIFWIPTTNNVAADPSGSVAPSSGCSSSTAYSSAANATCAWSNLPNGTNPASGSGLGWTAYSSTAKCNSSLPATDRELFECEYGNTTGASTPPSDEYAAFRSLAQGYLAAGACATDTIAAQRSCIESGLDTTALPVANTAQHPYNYANPANGDHQYYATSTAGTATNATKTLAATNPMSNDSMFSWSGTNGSEQSTATPITVTVYRQTYSTSSNSWSTGVPQFTFTITHTDWSVTKQPSGVDYFPSTQDVTMYNTGATSTGTAAGSTGTSQPGDLYVQGVNGGGPVSLIGQDNVEVTGDITKGSGNDTSITNPISITAGNDVRNYHPVACVDQTAADINATTAGYCPNDITGLTSNALSNTSGTFFSWAPPAQYTNILAGGTRTIDAVLFTLSGSLHTDNFDRGTWVGNLVINGGVYQSHRGANGSQYTVSGGTTARTGTTLTYNYVNLTRADLQYVPTASYSTNPRVWNVVSTSAANNPASS